MARFASAGQGEPGQDRIGGARSVMALRGARWQDGTGPYGGGWASHGLERQPSTGMIGPGMLWWVAVWCVAVRQERWGRPRHAAARMARPRSGTAGVSWIDQPWRGESCRGSRGQEWSATARTA